MNKIIKSISLGVLLCVLCTIPTFAFGTNAKDVYKRQDEYDPENFLRMCSLPDREE